MKQIEKNQWVISEIIGITWWVGMSINSPPPLRAGRLWEALWNTQTLAHFGVLSAHLTMAWETQHFWVHSVDPTCSLAIATQWQQHCWS